MESAVHTEFSIYLAHRPGELAGVLEAAAASGIEITAVSVSDQTQRGLVRLMGQPEERLREVLESLVEAGAGPMLEQPVLVIPFDNRPGLFRDVAANLALAGVNVVYAYGAPAINGLPGRCVFRVSDVDRAMATLGSMA
ncbi:MAG: hypothetical protein H6811_02835 [Phycisphaeraceae bacterium]|nr:hypothetical protein [Phycisphaeraceae bacterium]